MLARAHKKFERDQHSEIYLLTLKEQDNTKMKLSLDMVSISASIVRSLSGKNWQDRYKADKISISFPATPNDKLNVFGDVIKIFEKFIIPGGEKLLF